MNTTKNANTTVRRFAINMPRLTVLLGLLGLAVVAIAALYFVLPPPGTVSGAAATSVDRSYDEIEHLRSNRPLAVVADRGYDEIENIRAARDGAVVIDHSYDEIENIRSHGGY